MSIRRAHQPRPVPYRSVSRPVRMLTRSGRITPNWTGAARREWTSVCYRNEWPRLLERNQFEHISNKSLYRSCRTRVCVRVSRVDRAVIHQLEEGESGGLLAACTTLANDKAIAHR